MRLLRDSIRETAGAAKMQNLPTPNAIVVLVLVVDLPGGIAWLVRMSYLFATNLSRPAIVTL